MSSTAARILGRPQLPDIIVECWWCNWHFPDYMPRAHIWDWLDLPYALCYECFEYYLAGGVPRQPGAWARCNYWVARFFRSLPTDVHDLVTDFIASPLEP